MHESGRAERAICAMAAVVMVTLALAGCAAEQIAAPPRTARTECERNGGAWLAGPSHCVVTAGSGGGM